MPKIMLDAGHYGSKYNAGAVSGYYESNMAWELHNYLTMELKSYGFEVGVTRTKKDTDLEVYKRGQKAKGYDVLISLHSNAASEETAKRVSVFRPINGTGKKLAELLADAVFSTMNLKEDKNWYRSVNTRAYSESKPTTDYYGVIRGAVSVGSIGIIVEHSFHTNKEACKWLMSSDNLKALAKAEAKALADYYGMTKTENDGIKIGDTETAYEPKVGDVVMLTPNATVYGKATKFSSWVYKSKLYVRDVDGSRVVVSTQKTGAITGTVFASDLILVEAVKKTEDEPEEPKEEIEETLPEENTNQNDTNDGSVDIETPAGEDVTTEVENEPEYIQTPEEAQNFLMRLLNHVIGFIVRLFKK